MSARASRPFRIGVCAEAFGFGPASKAAALVHGLAQRVPTQAIPLADSIAHEFLRREGIHGQPPLDIRTPIGQDQGRELSRGLDLALVVLIPEWVPILRPHVPVAYVDSLGFLWPRAFFDQHPALRSVDAYLVQEVFSASARLRSFGVQNVYEVGALVSHASRGALTQAGDIVHLGGLLNIFSAGDGLRYTQFATRLLHGVVDAGTRVLMSEAVRATNPDTGLLVPRTLSHREVMDAFAAATCVFTSPGMTALLELAALRAPVVPLPPQNLSQARILTEIARLPDMPAIWHMLADAYPVAEDVPEELGVAVVRSRNLEHAASGSFQRSYRQLAAAARAAARPLPENLVRDYAGVDDCVEHIMGLLARNQGGIESLATRSTADEQISSAERAASLAPSVGR